MIDYSRLLKKMNNEELIKVVGTSATKTIKKNGYIRMKTMEKICKHLKCQADDIISFK